MLNQYIQCVQNDNKNINAGETIEAIKNAGFNGCFVQWYDKDWDFSQQQQVDLCKNLGLKILFAHLGYKGINDIWLEGENGDELVRKYIKNLDECKVNGIDMVCMHLTSKSIAPDPSKIGVKRLQVIVDYAEKLGIKVAFENTKIFGYLEYVFDQIKNDNAGICYDAGHCHCHFGDKFNWNKFKNKIFAIHLHDNDGGDDQHLLPFEGTIDWQKLVHNLKVANYIGPIILESCYRNQYLDMSLLDFYKLSLKKAKEIYKLSTLN
ncbi:MAG: sugar phosphate isomerase/epimerase [Clostridia bacterium]|nr:sugar phosphate isomerase/epimerase [Clostridia bacterium]